MKHKVCHSLVSLKHCIQFISLVSLAVSFNGSYGLAEVVHRSYIHSNMVSLDPIQAIDTSAQMVITNSFDGLVVWSPALGIGPALATSWDIRDGKKTYVFSLRNGLIFSDSTEVNARDIQAHFKRLMAPSSPFRGQFEMIDRVLVDGPKKVVFKLRYPYFQFLQVLSASPARIVKKRGGKFFGVGPFLPDITSKNKIVLRHNPNYWGQKASVDRIEFAVIEEKTAIDLALKGALDDIASVKIEGAEFPESSSRWYTQNMWETWVIGFDQRVKPFHNQNLRAYFSRTLKSEDFVKNIFPKQQSAIGLIPWGVPGFIDPLGELSPVSGKNIDFSTVPKGQFDLLIPEEVEAAGKIANWITNSFAGKRTSLNPILTPFRKMMNEWAGGKMGAYLVSINTESPDTTFLLKTLHSRAAGNFLGVSNPDVDRWVTEAEHADDRATQTKYFAQANRYLLEQAATINLMHVRHRTWSKSCVDGIELSPISSGYFNYRGVRNLCH